MCDKIELDEKWMDGKWIEWMWKVDVESGLWMWMWKVARFRISHKS